MTIRTLLLAAALALMPLSVTASGRAACPVLKKVPGGRKVLELSQLNPLTWMEMFTPRRTRCRSNSTVTTRPRLIAWSQVLSRSRKCESASHESY